MAPPPFIRPVGDETQHHPLNYRAQVLHSMTRQFCRDETDSGLSIKYAVSGVERYRIGNQWHHITEKRFLLVNEHQSFQCRVESKVQVEGLCLYLDPALVYQIGEAWAKGHAGMLEHDPCAKSGQFFFTEKVYSLEENALGEFLKAAVPVLRDEHARAEMDAEAFFLRLSESLVRAQGQTDCLLGRMDQERKATREEIFRRVSLARQHMDVHFLDEINLDEMAQQAHFSKYHFLRCFKQVYGMSPYQYVLVKRLESAQLQLRQSRRSLTDIALESGFGDRRAFNKAFRKAYGQNPADYRTLAR